MAWISNNGVGTATDEIAGLAYLRDAASGGYAQAKFQLAELMLDQNFRRQPRRFFLPQPQVNRDLNCVQY